MTSTDYSLIIEECPDCGFYNIFAWNIEKFGYRAHCTGCGKPLFLCDECMCSKDELNSNAAQCNWRQDENGNKTCFRIKNNKKVDIHEATIKEFMANELKEAIIKEFLEERNFKNEQINKTI